MGEIPITEKELALRAKVSEIYYPGRGQRHVALAQLVKGCLSLELLRARGVSVDEAALDREAARIEANSKAPDLLGRIREACGGRGTGYRNAFVRVVYGERAVYEELFLGNPEIQKEAAAKAALLLRESQAAPAKFRAIAERMGLRAATLSLSAEKGIVRAEGGRDGSAGGGDAGQARRILEAVAGTRPGEMHPQPIEWAEGYQVVRIVRRSARETAIESAGVPKRSFDDWFWENASKVPVRVRDPGLRAKLLEEVSWAKNLSLE